MCLDEGTIQAFLDGELDAQFMEAAAEHLAGCENCSVALALAEEESLTAFSAIEREFDTLVPTHRLWTKINDSIETEKRNESIWHRFIAGAKSFGFNFTTITSFASLIIVGGIFAAAWMTNEQPLPRISAPSAGSTEIAVINLPKTDNAPVERINTSDRIEEISVSPAENEPVRQKETDDQDFRIVKTVYNESPRSERSNSRSVVPDAANPAPPVALPGEETYVKTITNLEEKVEFQKDLTLRPTERIAYEKDMAVLNDAIRRMKSEVEKNPNNEAAKKLLFASYQSKIDLLSSVSEKNEMMASLK